MKFEARKLLEHSTEELSSVLTGQFILLFDNNESLKVNAVETIMSSYIWDIIRRYPGIPLLPEYHIRTQLNKKDFNSKTINGIYSLFFKEIVLHYRHQPGFNTDELMRLIYQVNNNIYNKLRVKIAPWRVSLDILDFIKVVDNPVIDSINKNMELTPNGVDKANKDIIKTLMKDPSLDDSILAKGVRSGIMSAGQVVKCVGSIGYITDIDNYIFREPVTRNYTTGIRSMYDSIIESRSAAKSLQFSKAQLQNTQYGSRRMSLQSLNMINVHCNIGTNDPLEDDCGTDKYLIWTVKEGELKTLTGKYYLDETTGKLKAITENDTHLIDKTIKMRSVHYCNHRDAYGFCRTCFGQLAYSIPKDINVGLFCSVNVFSPISQAVLATKHLDGSAVVEGVTVAERDRLFLKPADSGNSYRLNSACAKYKPKIIIQSKEAKLLTQVYDVADVSELYIGRITNITDIKISYLTKEPSKNEDQSIMERETRIIPISLKRRLGSLTHDFLNFVKEKGWEYTDKGDYQIDLEGWDYSKLFITLPMKHHSAADRAADIYRIIESGRDEKERQRKSQKGIVAGFGSMLAEITTQINDPSWNISMNLAPIEVVLSATHIISSERHNYAIPRGFTTSEHGVLSNNMRYRSLSVAMMYQGHLETLSDPLSFLVKVRPDHPADALVVPHLMNFF